MDLLEYQAPPAPQSWEDLIAGGQLSVPDNRATLDGRPKSNSTGRLEVNESLPMHRPSLPDQTEMDQTKKVWCHVLLLLLFH